VVHSRLFCDSFTSHVLAGTHCIRYSLLILPFIGYTFSIRMAIEAHGLVANLRPEQALDLHEANDVLVSFSNILETRLASVRQCAVDEARKLARCISALRSENASLRALRPPCDDVNCDFSDYESVEGDAVEGATASSFASSALVSSRKEKQADSGDSSFMDGVRRSCEATVKVSNQTKVSAPVSCPVRCASLATDHQHLRAQTQSADAENSELRVQSDRALLLMPEGTWAEFRCFVHDTLKCEVQSLTVSITDALVEKLQYTHQVETACVPKQPCMSGPTTSQVAPDGDHEQRERTNTDDTAGTAVTCVALKDSEQSPPEFQDLDGNNGTDGDGHGTECNEPELRRKPSLLRKGTGFVNQKDLPKEWNRCQCVIS